MHFKRSRIPLALACSLILGLGTCPVPVAYGETSAEIQQRVNEAYATLQSYTAELELASNQLVQVQDDLESVKAEIEETGNQIEEKEAELEQAQEELSECLASSYKRGNASLLSVILGASDFSDLFSRAFYANKVAAKENEAIEAVQSAKAELEQKRSELAEQQEQQEQLVAEQQQKTQEVQAKFDEQQAYYQSLDAELQEKLAEEEALAAAQKAAEEEAARKAEEERQKQEEAQKAAEKNNSSSNSNKTDNQGSGGSNTPSGGSGSTGSGNTSTPSQPSYGNNSGNAPSSVVDVAMAQVGKSYVWAAAGPNSFDCSGLVYYSYAQVGYSVPHSSQALFNRVSSLGHLVHDSSSLKAGDLVFWGYSASSIYHVGIYIGGGQYVHASMPGVGVVVSSLNTGVGTYMGGGSPV